MIKVRPHHILCIQNYKGKGYSLEFTQNMDKIVEKLKHNPKDKIKITFSTDDVCNKCPNRQGEDLCISNYKVKAIDNKVIEYLDLKEVVYEYDHLVRRLKKVININSFKDICGECEWYKKGICKEIT